MTAEIGRQPWVVYPAESSPDGISLLTGNATSLAVSAPELAITLILFTLIYLFLIIGWARIVINLIKKGPRADEGDAILALHGPSGKPVAQDTAHAPAQGASRTDNDGKDGE